MNKSTTNFLCFILLLGAFTSNIFGQHVGDIGVDANAAGRLTTHIVADGGLGEPRRVFSARFGDTGVTNFTANQDSMPSQVHFIHHFESASTCARHFLFGMEMDFRKLILADLLWARRSKCLFSLRMSRLLRFLSLVFACSPTRWWMA